jgi:hypothetical protein
VFRILTTAHRLSVVESGEPPSTWSRVTNAVAIVVGWGRFWISLLITIGIHVGLVAGYVKINPYVSPLHLLNVPNNTCFGGYLLEALHYSHYNTGYNIPRAGAISYVVLQALAITTFLSEVGHHHRDIFSFMDFPCRRYSPAQ